MNFENSSQISVADRRDQILSAVGFASSVLLRSASWKDALQPALQRLGNSVEANRAYYFENHLRADGVLLTSQVAEWAAEGVEAQIDNPDLIGVSLVEAGMGRWVEVMENGRPLHGLVSDFPDSEREILEAQGIRSLVAMPVFSQNKFVGFLGFDDCDSLRAWANPEFDALFAAASAIGAAIDRHHLENQLRFAQKMEAVGSLAAGVAHDFNNMLQAIVGFTNIVKLKIDNSHLVQEHLDGILAASDRAHSLTSQLLSFSRKQDFKPRNLSLGDVCDSVMTMVRPIVGGNIELTVDIADPAPVVFADAAALSQVLMNLCLNARDAMPGGGHLVISCSSAAVNSDELQVDSETEIDSCVYACLTVSDTGSGMSDEVLERIFEPFFTTKAGQGTGLGLSVAYGTVKQCGGFIGVKSDVNDGTEFHIYLPISTDAVVTVESSTDFVPGNETVLLVDDEPMVLLSTQNLLQASGYTVLVAKNGQQGLDTYHQHSDKIAIVLTDSVMPEMDGVTMIENIRKSNPGVKVILISGYATDSVTSLRDQSNVVVLQKPACNETLQQSIRSLLD